MQVFPPPRREPGTRSAGRPTTLRKMMERPSAFLPVAMSLVAFALVIVHVTMFGAAREPDEGTAAHLWQLLMAAQVPIIAFFAIRWLPQSPRPAATVLGLQAMAALASLAPVFLLNL